MTAGCRRCCRALIDHALGTVDLLFERRGNGFGHDFGAGARIDGLHRHDRDVDVRELVDGKPAAGIKLIGDYRGAPHEVSAETDAEGRANVPVRNEGLNIISAALVTL